MFLTDEERELLKKELKWHKISDEKPKEGELCRLLPKEDFLILPIAFLDDGIFKDFDIVGEYHNNATHWVYEKEVDEYLNQFPIREEIIKFEIFHTNTFFFFCYVFIKRINSRFVI